jgi:hypothetical protein
VTIIWSEYDTNETNSMRLRVGAEVTYSILNNESTSCVVKVDLYTDNGFTSFFGAEQSVAVFSTKFPNLNGTFTYSNTVGDANPVLRGSRTATHTYNMSTGEGLNEVLVVQAIDVANGINLRLPLYVAVPTQPSFLLPPDERPLIQWGSWESTTVPGKLFRIGSVTLVPPVAGGAASASARVKFYVETNHECQGTQYSFYTEATSGAEDQMDSTRDFVSYQQTGEVVRRYDRSLTHTYKQTDAGVLGFNFAVRGRIEWQGTAKSSQAVKAQALIPWQSIKAPQAPITWGPWTNQDGYGLRIGASVKYSEVTETSEDCDYTIQFVTENYGLPQNNVQYAINVISDSTGSFEEILGGVAEGPVLFSNNESNLATVIRYELKDSYVYPGNGAGTAFRFYVFARPYTSDQEDFSRAVIDFVIPPRPGTTLPPDTPGISWGGWNDDPNTGFGMRVGASIRYASVSASDPFVSARIFVYTENNQQGFAEPQKLTFSSNVLDYRFHIFRVLDNHLLGL